MKAKRSRAEPVDNTRRSVRNKYNKPLMEANNCWCKKTIPIMTPTVKGSRSKYIARKEKWN